MRTVVDESEAWEDAGQAEMCSLYVASC